MKTQRKIDHAESRRIARERRNKQFIVIMYSMNEIDAEITIISNVVALSPLHGIWRQIDKFDYILPAGYSDD